MEPLKSVLRDPGTPVEHSPIGSSGSPDSFSSEATDLKSITPPLIHIPLVGAAKGYGTLLGSANGVEAYSNQDPSHVSKEPSYTKDNVYSGMKWQCVEYSRRYMQQKSGFTFSDVYGAHNIWHLEHAAKVSDGTEVAFNSIANGKSTVPPKVGNLIIYPISEDTPYGHVAVITNVEGTKAFVAEQNWDNSEWPGDKSYSRVLNLTTNSAGKHVLTDESGLQVLGWKALE
ncbi:MAG: CHAP domain-containing protein [Myxococcaceae bacterium]